MKQIGNNILITLLLILPALASQATTQQVGSLAIAITPAEMERIGQHMMRRLRSRNLVVDDPLVQNYIETLGYSLSSASDDPQRHFSFFVVKNQTINAFAAPGGYIGIHSGLIDIAKNESELAGVMAHEIAHITQNHLERLFAHSKRNMLAMTAGILLAMVVSDKEVRKAVAAGAIAGSQQASINFTRGNEHEADNHGIKILVGAGFDPNGMAKFFERMDKNASLYGTRLPEFLSTHPVSSTRISEAKNRIAALQISNKKKDSINFYLIKARLRVLRTKNRAKLIPFFKAKMRNGRTAQDRTAAQYGLVLVYTDTRQYAAASRLLAPLLKRDETRLAYIVASADIALQQKQAKQVIEIYDTAKVMFPKSYALTYYYSDALLALNQHRKAYQFLQDYMRDKENTMDAKLHRNYAFAADRSGHKGEALQHLAESYYLTGRTNAAIFQLQKATKLKLDQYLSERIHARLAELKLVAKQEKRKKRRAKP